MGNSTTSHVDSRFTFKSLGAGVVVEIVRCAIATNSNAVADFKAGTTNAAQAIKGAVMRETKGTAKPEVVVSINLEEIQKAK